MGEHSAPGESWVHTAGAFLWAHRRKIASGILLALPIVSRYVPEFPTDEVVRLVRLFLGA